MCLAVCVRVLVMRSEDLTKGMHASIKMPVAGESEGTDLNVVVPEHPPEVIDSVRERAL